MQSRNVVRFSKARRLAILTLNCGQQNTEQAQPQNATRQFLGKTMHSNNAIHELQQEQFLAQLQKKLQKARPFTGLLLGFFIGLFTLTAFAQSSDDSARLAVQQRDIELNELIINLNVDAAAEYYDSKFVLTTSALTEKSKADMLRDIARLSIEVNEKTDVVVRVRASTAVLTGALHRRGELNGKKFDVRVRVTDTWHLSNGKWILLAGHANLIQKTCCGTGMGGL